MDSHRAPREALSNHQEREDMSILKRVLFASGPVIRVLMGAGAIVLLIAGLKKPEGNKDKARIQKKSAQTLNKK